MQWDELMKEFADVVGRALARRWLAQRLTSGKQKTERQQESIGKDEADHLHNSHRPETEADCEMPRVPGSG